MDVETLQQITDLEELKRAHAARLRMLELQDAKSGRSTPPEVAIEIQDIKAKIVPIDAAIFKLTYIGHVRADVPGKGREGQQVGRAAERALEQHRRAFVASQMDTDLRNEVRMASIVESVRHALLVVGGLALAALLIAGGTVVYLLSRGGG